TPGVMALSVYRKRGENASGRLQVVVLQVVLNIQAAKPYVRLSLGDQIYQTSISEEASGQWNEGFEFDVTFHDQLFGICQLDLYDMRYLLPDRHLGRAEIMLSHLQSMPNQFTTCVERGYVEFWNRRQTIGNLGQAGVLRTYSENLGAVQVRIGHRFSQTHAHTVGTDIHILTASPTCKSAEGEFIKTEEQDDDNDDDSSGGRIATNAAMQSGSYRQRRARRSALGESADDSNITEQDALMELDDEDDIGLGEEDELVELDGPMARADQRIVKGSLIEFFSNLIVTEEVRQVLKAITRLFMVFGQGMELGHVQLLAGASILRAYYSRATINHSGESVKRLIDIDLPAHFYRFTMASYGWRGLNFFGKGNGIIRDSIRKHSDAASVREYLNLEEGDLLAYEFHAKDRETDSVVLCIRGTMSIKDTLTDLVCDYQQWKGGLVHAGILSAAQWFLTDVVPQMLAYCRQHNIQRVRLVGHSLGGATASILAILLRDHLRMMDNINSTEPHVPSSNGDRATETTNGTQSAANGTGPSREQGPMLAGSPIFREPLDIRCYAFGPPCCVSLDISRQYADIIDAYVLESDIVCRLSYGSVMDLKAMILSAACLTDRHYEEVLSFGLGSSKIVEEEQLKRQATLDTARQRLICTERPQNPKLYIAGRVHYLHREGSEATGQKQSQQPPSSSSNAAAGQGDRSNDAIAENRPVDRLTADPVHKRTTAVISAVTGEPTVRVEMADALHFAEIVIAPSMFVDHLPSSYEVALERARASFVRDAV
ncbi:hypothetical protein THASP1DRAFT_25420, partial [Thamnocephalis sphaerospora]